MATRSVDTPLSVVVLSWRGPGDPDAGGSELHAREILRRWVEMGVDVTVVTRCPSRSEDADAVAVPSEGLSVVHTGGTYSVFASAPARVLARGPRGDVTVEILNGVPFWSPLWRRRRSVVWLHHMHTEMWAQTLPRPMSDIGRWVESTIVPRVYGTPVVTLSHPGADELRHRGFRDVRVVEPGIAPRFLTAAPAAVDPGEPPRLVAVGRLAPVKRWIELLLAVEAMQAPGRPVLLDIVGGGPMRDEIDAWCRSHNAQWVTCHGVVSDSRLVEIYQSATLVVSASSSEGWGMTITEAAACGVPAVVTDVVGHRGAVVDGRTGMLVPTPRDLTATVLGLLDDRQRLGHMASAARERASSLSWEAAAVAHLDIVRERVADGHR